MKNRNLTLLSKRFENQLYLHISWFYSRRCKYTNQKLHWNLSFLVEVHCDLWCYICLSIWCCRVIVNSRRFLTSNWIPLVPGELGFNHDVKILYTLFSNDMDSWHCSNIIHSNISSVVATTKYHSLHIIMIHDSIPFTYLVLTSAGNKILVNTILKWYLPNYTLHSTDFPSVWPSPSVFPTLTVSQLGVSNPWTSSVFPRRGQGAWQPPS